MSRVKPIVIQLLLMILLSPVAVAAENSKTPSLPERNINEVTFPAVAKAWRSASLYSRSTGIVENVLVEVGQRVSQGDILIIINNPIIQTELAALNAQLKETQADLELRFLELERASKLLSDSLIGVAQSDQLRIEVEKTKAEKEAIEANIALKRFQQDFLTIRAPFDGVIINREVDKGDLVIQDNKSSKPLIDIVDISKLRIQFAVPQQSLSDVKVGYPARFVTSTFGREFNTVINLKVPDVDRNLGTLYVESWIKNPDNLLPAGIRGEVRLNVE